MNFGFWQLRLLGLQRLCGERVNNVRPPDRRVRVVLGVVLALQGVVRAGGMPWSMRGVSGRVGW